jgi:hypothetical protein
VSVVGAKIERLDLAGLIGDIVDPPKTGEIAGAGAGGKMPVKA